MTTKFQWFDLKLILALVLFATSAANAQMASWDYEPIQGSLATPTPNIGSGSSSVVNLGGGTITPGGRTGMTGTGCGTQNGVTAWALEPFDPGSINEGNGAQFNSSTYGYQNISFTWDQRWSNTCPNTARLQYTLDGSSWTNFTMTSGNTTYCIGSINVNGCFEVSPPGDVFTRISVNLSSITGANNNANFGVRVVASYYQSSGQFRQATSPAAVAGVLGTWRFDNVAFTGTLIPGPTSSVISASPSAVCAGGSANISVAITGGSSPFTLTYFDGTSNIVVNNYVSGTNIPVTPAATTTYKIVSVTNTNNAQPSTSNTPAAGATVTVNPLPSIPGGLANFSGCPGSTALPGGYPSYGANYPSVGYTSNYYNSVTNAIVTFPYSGATFTFYYKVTNNLTSCFKTSPVYTFTRNVAPSITAQPSNGSQTVCQNDPFSPLSVGATGTAPLTYQWYRNTIASTTGGTPLTGASFAAEVANGSKTATFTPLSNVVGTYYYYVAITNSCGSIKSIATGAFIVVAASVAGTVSPAQTVCAGTLPADLTLAGNVGSVLKWQKALDFGFTSGVQDIAVTSATLTGAAIGTLSQTTFIRAFVQNGSCTIVTTVPIQLLVKSTTWTGTWSNGVPDSATTAIFNADYSSTGNLSACSATVNSGNIIFNPGHTLILQNALTVSGGTLTFENNASLLQVNNVANSGNIDYKRDSTGMRAFDYTYWSSPVDSQIMAIFSPLTRFDKYFWWNPVIYNWSQITAPGITPMEVGKGYIMRAPSDFDPVVLTVFHGVFNGVPNNGDYPAGITVSGAGNLNLLGNPYPSAISADLFMSDPGNMAAIGTGSSIYLWTHNSPISAQQYVFSDYAVYNYTGGTGTSAAPGTNNSIPNGYIAAGQGFMIRGLASGTATFKNSMRVAGNNNQFFRASNDVDKHRIWLDLTNSDGVYKQILLGYVTGATNAIDRGFDAETVEAGNPVSFYTIAGSTKLSIQGRALPFENSDTVQLGYNASASGSYLIALSNFDGLFEGQDVFLEDHLTHVIQSLKDGNYAFATEAGTFDDRFTLRFTDNSLGANTPTQESASVVAYAKNDAVFVTASETIDSVEAYDVSGRLVANVKGVNSKEVVLQVDGADGILLVRIKISDGVILNKKIIK